MEGNTLKDLQRVEYDMLKDITKFCDDNDIKYFIIAGTLLGAVRHGGFIPWDDDIDIGMDLINYKKFLKLAENKLPKKYFLQHYSKERKVCFPWIKIRINNTTCMERRCVNYDVHSGVSMDIFLLNGISPNKFRRFIQTKANEVQRTLLIKYYYRENNLESKSNKRKIVLNMVPEFLRIPLIKFLDRLIVLELEKSTQCFNTYYMYLDDCYKFTSSWFLDLEKIRFEDADFWAPKEKIKYLETRYGDWQSPPPEEDRVGHGDLIIDLYNDYSMYFGRNDLR